MAIDTSEIWLPAPHARRGHHGRRMALCTNRAPGTPTEWRRRQRTRARTSSVAERRRVPSYGSPPGTLYSDAISVVAARRYRPIRLDLSHDGVRRRPVATKAPTRSTCRNVRVSSALLSKRGTPITLEACDAQDAMGLRRPPECHLPAPHRQDGHYSAIFTLAAASTTHCRGQPQRVRVRRPANACAGRTADSARRRMTTRRARPRHHPQPPGALFRRQLRRRLGQRGPLRHRHHDGAIAPAVDQAMDLHGNGRTPASSDGSGERLGGLRVSSPRRLQLLGRRRASAYVVRDGFLYADANACTGTTRPSSARRGRATATTTAGRPALGRARPPTATRTATPPPPSRR